MSNLGIPNIKETPIQNSLTPRNVSSSDKFQDFGIKFPLPSEITTEKLRKMAIKKKKPSNSFIIYRLEYIKEIKKRGLKPSMTQISSKVAEAWRREPKEVKDCYKKLARQNAKLITEARMKSLEFVEHSWIPYHVKKRKNLPLKHMNLKKNEYKRKESLSLIQTTLKQPILDNFCYLNTISDDRLNISHDSSNFCLDASESHSDLINTSTTQILIPYLQGTNDFTYSDFDTFSLNSLILYEHDFSMELQQSINLNNTNDSWDSNQFLIPEKINLQHIQNPYEHYILPYQEHEQFLEMTTPQIDSFFSCLNDQST
ncbi:hypothetical protein G9A89_000178 [Geosiphon pyriformis]|nr:hypothetical protein G9A89_000178 [Geosiphon pyriformis]